MDKLLRNYSYTLASLKTAFLNVYNLSGGKRNYDVDTVIGRSDRKVIEEDWKYVGQDMMKSIEEYSKYDR
ncbi:hypothetical protein [Peptostreptococcus stomatis]|jgi:hypothetical protein|uniref:hypothetical protein n=1 Tax=Peptostreptococcus stomatis TaxID=341694 RepID=UPI0026F302F2|nr:hypothetical protein [Peptostreptococcus stomatis]